MSQLLVVFGATGQQGGSIVEYVTKDPELSQKFKVRAISRDVNSDKAKQLSTQDVEVVQADLNDRESLKRALKGAHTVFAMTLPVHGTDSYNFEAEYEHGKAIADVSVESGAEYIIFSTLPAVKDTISAGKYTQVIHFDAKAHAENYIRNLPIKSAFFSPGSFMSNFGGPLWAFVGPHRVSDDTWVLTSIQSPKTKVPFIDVVGDTGKYIGAILAEPDKYQGKTFCASTEEYSWEGIATAMSKSTGKAIVYKQGTVEDLKKVIPPPFFRRVYEVFSYVEEFGYYGPESSKLVAWAAANARGKLSTIDDYLQAHPLQLP